MKDIIEEIIERVELKKIFFSEPFYKSSDGKTILGEVAFKEILFMEYRDTEAGSNPREYTGLKNTNLQLLRSLLQDSTNMFRFLHSGVILCLTVDSSTGINTQSVKYEECCLTNGNQTRFVILLIALMKLYFGDKEITLIRLADYNRFIQDTFGRSETATAVLNI